MENKLVFYGAIAFVIIVTAGVIYFSLSTRMIESEDNKYCMQWRTTDGWTLYRDNLIYDIYDWKDSTFKFVYIINEDQSISFYEAGEQDTVHRVLHDAYHIIPSTGYIGSFNCTKFVNLIE